MINLPPVRRMSPTATPAPVSNRDRVESTANTGKRQPMAMDRRYRRDRRARRGEKQVMDRRLGTDRRRSSINFKV